MKLNNFNKPLKENLSNSAISKSSNSKPVIEKPSLEDNVIYGVKPNSRWARRLKETNPSAYANLTNWD